MTRGKNSKKHKRRMLKLEANGAETINSTGPFDPLIIPEWDVAVSGYWQTSPNEKVVEVQTPEWVDPTPPKTEAELEQETIERNLAGWPWGKTVPLRLVTAAPYVISNFHNPLEPFALAEVEQTALLFTKLLENDLIRQKITKLLFRNHDTAYKFAATSRQSWRYLVFHTDFWDISRGWFNNCELPQSNTVNGGETIAIGSVAPVVIVSPLRGPKNLSNLDPESVLQPDYNLYADQMDNLRKMCLSISNFADFFRIIQLHRVPFLTTQVLSLLIPSMRNLRVLGIYKCQLIHIGDTMKLLEIIKTDKVLEKENQISLDFFPNYHVGPVEVPGDEYCTGSYGVTWDNWNGDTRIAVWALVSRILPQARKQDLDFESPHTMFRQYLDKTPCWRVAETLKVMMDPEKDELDLAVMIDYPNTGGSYSQFTSKNCPNRPEGWKWATQRFNCNICRTQPLGIFFYYNHLRQARNDGTLGNLPSPVTCMGCLLTTQLNEERDHYKLDKRSIIQRWLHGSQGWNTDNLPRALGNYYTKNVEKQAVRLDQLRMLQITREGYPDREYAERQNKFTTWEKTRLGTINMSPVVSSKDPVLDEWNSICTHRKWGHGH